MLGADRKQNATDIRDQIPGINIVVATPEGQPRRRKARRRTHWYWCLLRLCIERALKVMQACAMSMAPPSWSDTSEINEPCVRKKRTAWRRSFSMSWQIIAQQRIASEISSSTARSSHVKRSFHLGPRARQNTSSAKKNEAACSERTYIPP